MENYQCKIEKKIKQVLRSRLNFEDVNRTSNTVRGFTEHLHRILFCCSRVLMSLCCILTLDANFLLTVTILFSLPILTFV